ncbi:ATP-grasp fold amidoligase family protein [Mucilaginibacter sp.]|jgi:hypothetical protein|uniref:ATP-grasp fold amidoligase family protein n=1 Tax=Mucilaginibacter sp. TaxID=1882438 RepID=UPI00356522B9
MLAFIGFLKIPDDISARIRTRHKKFWSDPDAEKVRNTFLTKDDPLEKWKNVENWQRRLSNKLNSRNFALAHNCRVPQLYWSGRNIKDINFDAFPENYVIRPTIGHSSQLVFLMKKNYNLFECKTYSTDELKAVLQQAVNKNENLHFLVEEFLKNEQGKQKILKDYKFLCFNGEIACINVVDRFSPTSGTCTYYNEKWEELQSVNKIYPSGSYSLPPKCLNEMLAQAKYLSRSYEIFVRIDFYATDKGAVFGEFTPTPGMGAGFTNFGKKLMINYWNKYCRGMI